jgi:nitrite reductase/ring-hydroxylating ferredoxin subunit
VSPGWHDIAGLDELGEGRLEKRLLGEVPLVLLRRGGEVDVLAGLCSHLSGPLHEGNVAEEDGETCVVCPWHRSTFSLRTGEVVHGPATSPQPSFETRVVGGVVQVCLPGAG